MKNSRISLRVSALPTLVAATLMLLLTACGGIGTQPDRAPAPREEPVRLASVEGVVKDVDARQRIVWIRTDRHSEAAPDQRVPLHYNDDTRVTFERRDYRPEDLERGDRVVADVSGELSHFRVETIYVIEDASPDNADAPVAVEGDIIGWLREIDMRDRVLRVEQEGAAPDTFVYYDDRTRVYHDGRGIRVDDLREYDDVAIRLVPGSRRALADTITVLDEDAPAPDVARYDEARGEVLYIDEARHELAIVTRDPLGSTWDRRDDYDPRNRFDTGDNDQVVFRYARDVIVEYRGDFYAPSNLERGDGVEIEYEREGGELWAKRIVVTSNVRE